MFVPSVARLASSLRVITDQSSPRTVVAHLLHEAAEMRPVGGGAGEVDERREHAHEPDRDHPDHDGPDPDATPEQQQHHDPVRRDHRQDPAHVGTPHRRDVDEHRHGEHDPRDHVAATTSEAVGQEDRTAQGRRRVRRVGGVAEPREPTRDRGRVAEHGVEHERGAAQRVER